jgi:glycosyltransferase involved in cell wall biosynthesis
MNPMKVLVNATGCVVGGGVQVATSFIHSTMLNSNGHDFRFVVSEPVLRNLETIFNKKLPNICLISPRPGKPIAGSRSRKSLKAIERETQPDFIFSIFGPAYVKFRSPHICGFASPWMLFPDSLANKILTMRERVKIQTIGYFRKQFLKQADGFIVETNNARQALAELLKIPEDRINVVPNGYHPVFDVDTKIASGDKYYGYHRVLTISSYYPHKNLELIPYIARSLKQLDGMKKYLFTLTLPPEGDPFKKILKIAHELSVEDCIDNVGPVSIKACPSLYANSDIVLHPSLLEVFSVSYLEAMRMERPIVTTDLDFAREICGTAAVYYSPLSAKSAAEAIMELSYSGSKYSEYVQKGKQRISQFPNPVKRHELQIRVLENFSNNIEKIT